MDKSFSCELTTEKSPKAVLGASLKTLTEPLHDWGYRLTTQSEAAVTYERTYRPWYAWVFGILFIPVLVGIAILIFVTETSMITILIEERKADTRVLIRGTAPRRVREAFETMPALTPASAWKTARGAAPATRRRHAAAHYAEAGASASRARRRAGLGSSRVSATISTANAAICQRLTPNAWAMPWSAAPK